jgi:hypothetical protein
MERYGKSVEDVSELVRVLPNCGGIPTKTREAKSSVKIKARFQLRRPENEYRVYEVSGKPVVQVDEGARQAQRYRFMR